MKRIKILKAYLWAFGVLAFLWWPMGHWVYPGWYHTILGFESYVSSFIKVIGTLSVLPILGAFFILDFGHFLCTLTSEFRREQTGNCGLVPQIHCWCSFLAL
jgi:hypothetical protein